MFGVSGNSFVLLLLFGGCAWATLSPPTQTALKEKVLSRKRRYIAFPEGSSASAAICLTVGVLGNPNVAFLSWAVNWGVAYDLPNYTWAKQHAHGFQDDDNNKDVKALAQRRSRRELYDKITVAINSMGYDGEACMARALCESSKHMRRPQTADGRPAFNMLEEIVHTIFSLPEAPVQAHEHAMVHHYDRVYRRAPRHVRDCRREYAGCHFSLLEMALGHHLVQPTKHGPAMWPPHFM